MIENGRLANPGLSGAKARIAVASAKGGAGKSALSVNVAAQMALSGRKVGILDADLGAPSIATMLGLMPGILFPENGNIEPAAGPLGLKAVGLDLIADLPAPLVSQNELGVRDGVQRADGAGAPVYSSRPGEARLLLNGVSFADLDVLLIDLATGLGPLREVAEAIALNGVVIVTQSSPSALRATRSLAAAARSLGVAVLGIVENMTAFYCRQCRSVRPLLAQGAIVELSRETKLPLLARLPFDPRLAEACERGLAFVQQMPDTPLAKQLGELAQKVATAAEQVAYELSANGAPAQPRH